MTIPNDIKSMYYDACKHVLIEALEERGVTEFSVCGIDMSKSEGLIKVVHAILG